MTFYSSAAALTTGQDRFDRLSSGVLFDGINASDPNTDGTSVFKDFCNHANAVASMLLYHAKDAGFDPSTNGVSTPSEAYFGFLQNVADFSALYSLSSNDLEQFLEQVAQKFRMDSETKADRTKVAFRALVPTM
ncbi:hypothetical protein BG011_006804 [Mortierella polycephala]|uniref:Uncharacterized protein n=1 Tax=Mortierella polycephala TaxID=41804 RepID=A0A9P6U8Q8_9FUNG|nr:hypothetical protein BG011_006804 [Mortierella polycephala]